MGTGHGAEGGCIFPKATILVMTRAVKILTKGQTWHSFLGTGLFVKRDK